VFRTNFRNQNYNFANPANPSQQQNINADLRTNGVEVDAVVRPTTWFSLDFQGVFQDPKLVNLQLDGQTQLGFEGNRPERRRRGLWSVQVHRQDLRRCRQRCRTTRLRGDQRRREPEPA
jgi:outer membrane receptor protein involved in Fe transport